MSILHGEYKAQRKQVAVQKVAVHLQANMEDLVQTSAVQQAEKLGAAPMGFKMHMSCPAADRSAVPAARNSSTLEGWYAEREQHRLINKKECACEKESKHQ